MTRGAPLPEDVGTLQHLVVASRQMIATQAAEIDALRDTVQSSTRLIEQLKHQLEAFRRSVYGQKSERVVTEQGLLSFAGRAPAPPAAPPAPAEPPATAADREGHGRRPLPAHLRREEVVHDVAPEDRVCDGCHQDMAGIGEDVLEQLEYKPGRLFVRRLVRKKYACRKCGAAVVTAAPHPQVIEKGLPGPWLLSHIVTSKYSDHLPLHRLEGMLLREGVHISRSTMVGWIAEAAKLLEPLVRRMKELLLSSGYVRTDETPVRVLDEGKTRTAYVRVWACDRRRRWRVFEYAVNRSGALVRDFLEDWRGQLQCDAYSGYDGVFASGRVLEIACWAHTRRYFFDAKESDSEIAHGALARIGLLYDVERVCDEADKADRPGTPPCIALARRLKARREKSRPILGEFSAWIRAVQSSVLPKSPIGTAVTYALNQWDALSRYIELPHVAIDNNLAERELRAVAVGRKNWEFAGSDEGGRRAATLYSITATCKANGVNPEAYMADVFMRLATTPESRIDELLPDLWTASSTAQVVTAKP